MSWQQAGGMRVSLLLVLTALAACGGGKPVVTAPHVSPEVGLAAVHQARCAACHALGSDASSGDLDEQLSAGPAKPLALLASSVDLERQLPDLTSHFGGQHAADLRQWLGSLAGAREPRLAAEIPGGAIARGEQLARELACGACHNPAELNLATKSDHVQLAAFLSSSGERASGPAHVTLTANEASAVAAWLLRDQRQEGAVGEGFGYQYFEMEIPNGDWPDVSGRTPSDRGVVQVMNTAIAARKTQYAIQFDASLDVPAAGSWQFATASDDGSWLWIDGQLVVNNPGMKPTTRKDGRINLSKGAHQLRVAYTQGGGGAALKVFWAGPGVAEQEVPGASARSSVLRLVPPAVVATALDEEAVVRGRAAARAARCDACHEVADPEFAKLPPPPAAKSWAALASHVKAGTGADASSKAPATSCAMPAGSAVYGEVGAMPAKLTAATRLRIALQADGCLSCHVRNGEGGLPAAVKKQLREIEDIGEEGMVPPDLSQVGRRLRSDWLQRVVRDGHKVRDYVAMRMPAYGEQKAQQYAEWFAAVDAAGVVDQEPEFRAEAAEHGRTLAGTGGRNCISCHTFAGREALGPQGMDLALQYQRLRPGWFRDWLLKPTELRPNTRMPTLWFSGTDQDQQDVDAIRTWLSLGEAAPLPSGLMVDKDSLVLEPVDRPVLHGAFLKDVSARCLAVGTPMRTHFAFDLVKPRLAWIWRGAFLDARGTWHGRAGQLLEPLGTSWQVVQDFEIEGESDRRLLGQRRTEDGYPVLRVACGSARYQDQLRPRLAAGGSELERTIRCEEGTLVLKFPATDSYRATVAGQPAGEHTLTAGQSLKVLYQW